MSLFVAPDGHDNPTVWRQNPDDREPIALLTLTPANAELFDLVADCIGDGL